MYFGKQVIHIVAVDEAMSIGDGEKMLWHIPQDLQYFREATLGHSVVMGRKTVDSLPKPLDRRIVTTVSRDGFGQGLTSHEASMNMWMSWAAVNSDVLGTEVIFVAGGESIYAATEKWVDKVYITRISEEFPCTSPKKYKMPDGFEFVGYAKPSTAYDGVLITFEVWENKNPLT